MLTFLRGFKITQKSRPWQSKNTWILHKMLGKRKDDIPYCKYPEMVGLMVMNPMVQSNNQHLPTKPFDSKKMRSRVQPQKRLPKIDPNEVTTWFEPANPKNPNGMSWGVKLPPFFEALFGVILRGEANYP